MDTERSATIVIGGKPYELILTTRATKEIARRYGGLENLGEKLMKSENFEMALDEVVWLITLLANQSILVHNLKKREAPEPLLTEDEVELLTSPLDLAAYKEAMNAKVSGYGSGVETAGTSITQNISVVSPKALSEKEIAREFKNLSRKLALEY